MALGRKGQDRQILSAKTVDLPAGAAAENFSASAIGADVLTEALRQSLSGRADARPGRASLCLPDALFRVQTLEFDEFPSRSSDQARLILWRLEKAAAFNLAESVLRHQVLRRPKGVTVLACLAKKALIEQYEALLTGLGLEVSSIAPSSFAVANLYTRYMTARSRSFAITHLTADSFATLVSDKGGVNFYRFKDVKRGGAAEVSGRFARDIADSLHFYTHKDRTQQAQLTHLYLSGEPGLCDALARELGQEASFEVEAVSADRVLPDFSKIGARAELAAAAGAAMSS